MTVMKRLIPLAAVWLLWIPAQAGTLVINTDASDPAPKAAFAALVKGFEAANPDIKVMMLTTFDVDDKVFNAICLGADGYMLKTDFASQMPHEAMRKSLRTIFEGGAYLTPSVAKRILNLFSDATIADKIKKVSSFF